MEVDWASWQPKEYATLLFVVRDGHILLIRKKRGLGAGKINGPGGRIELGETSLEAAVRETREELGIVPVSPELRGELHFQFVDGYSLHCSVFVAGDFIGEPVETARPFRFGPRSMRFLMRKCGRTIFVGSRSCSPDARLRASFTLNVRDCSLTKCFLS
jgi:8-oxo-dGTP pyrophosphatase MutT (NUDIX family)